MRAADYKSFAKDARGESVQSKKQEVDDNEDSHVHHAHRSMTTSDQRSVRNLHEEARPGPPAKANALRAELLVELHINAGQEAMPTSSAIERVNILSINDQLVVLPCQSHRMLQLPDSHAPAVCEVCAEALKVDGKDVGRLMDAGAQPDIFQSLLCGAAPLIVATEFLGTGVQLQGALDAVGWR